MFPRLVTFEPFNFLGRTLTPPPLHTYGVLLAIAFLLSLWLASRLARRQGLESTHVADMSVYVLIAGLVGAKLLLALVEWQFYWRHPRELVTLIQSGGVFYGGLLGALPVAWWCARKFDLPGWKTADALAPAVVLGQAIGRLGCFAAGCCHGRPASVPWAVTFRDPYAARAVGTPLDVPLHPTQIYESLACFAILGVLLWMFGRRRFDGQVTFAYILLYSVARFVIEFFRGDASRGSVLGGLLSTSQFIAIVLVLGTLLYLPYHLKKYRAPAPPAPPAA